MANMIFAGPNTENVPQVKEKIAGAAFLPGAVVVMDGEEFVPHDVAGGRGRYYVAQENYLAMKDVTDEYAIGDLAIGMIPLDEQFFYCRIAASQTIGEDTPLASNGSGLLVAAAAEDEVLFYAEEAVTTGAGETALCLSRVANGAVPAA
ncbi:hypothetical protein [uncultured Halomonas sp.]|uniref:hypothetical protein n=1 Tax=uncultured Halomonas sp. TaxID=173971 RepID=UPI0026362AFC|nr:hypothetical protein [uncultured Halomonas sp.]